jgi:hypothetical protein
MLRLFRPVVSHSPVAAAKCEGAARERMGARQAAWTRRAVARMRGVRYAIRTVGNIGFPVLCAAQGLGRRRIKCTGT